MANPAPTINQINAFNATQGTTIDFNIIGGTELVRSNRIYIYDLSDNSLICTHLYVSTESIHELPANTDSSIVYESGKSSANFINGAQYYAQIQTFTDIAGTEGGSGLSVAKMFWCLVDPTLTITTIPSTISTTSYNVSATYNANTSVVSNIIQQYQFSLYSATGSLLQSSGVVVGSGTQQGTSTAYDISYNFTGLSVGSSYYVVVDVTTTQGMSVSVQSNTFTVSIDTPTLGEATVVNNACDGYISVTSNLSSEYGGSGSGEIVSFETDSENVFTKLQVDLEPIQSGSGTPSPSNVRPISGHDDVDVVHTGVNVWDEEWEVGGLLWATGAEYAEPTSRRTDFLKVIPNGTYYIVAPYACGVVWFDENKVFVSNNLHIENTTITVPSNAVYGRFVWTGVGSGTPYGNNISINHPSTDHEYHAYNGEEIHKEIEVTYTPTVQENEPYQFKRTGDVGGDRESIELVGGSVAWNQLVQNVSSGWENNGITYTANGDGSITLNGTATANSYFNVGSAVTGTANHVILLLGCPKGGSAGYSFKNGYTSARDYGDGNISKNGDSSGRFVGQIYVTSGTTVSNLVFKPQAFDLTQMFGSTIADYIYSLEQGQAGAGVAFFRKYFPKPYYPYDAGTIKSVEGVSAHKTVGFNAWDEEWENGYIDDNGNNVAYANAFRSKNYIPVAPNTAYCITTAKTMYLKYYDADKNYIGKTDKDGYGNVGSPYQVRTMPSNCGYIRFYIDNTSTYSNDICINLSWDGERNGEYEPYVEHSYPLDDSLTLRGVFQVENGKLKAYGDEYPSDGNGTERFTLVDLGSITPTKYDVAQGTLFRFPIGTTIKKSVDTATLPNIICAKYVTVTNASRTNKTISMANNTEAVDIIDNDYSSASAIQTAMNGVYLLYEKATPTPFTAQPFENIQNVTPNYGTEEFVTTTNVPVGNNTQYYTRDIYGGYIDLVSGRLVVTHGHAILNGQTDGLRFTEVSQATTADGTKYVAYIPLNTFGMKLDNVALCDSYDFKDTPVNNLHVGEFDARGSYMRFVIVDQTLDTLAKWNEYLANNPMQLVYELSTPLTYQLTPQQIQTLVGVNNVWSEQGDVELSYHIPITNLLVKRQDVADVSGDWLTLYSQPITQASDMDFTFIDFTNQYGKTYKYALVPLLTQTQSGVEVEVEGGYTVSDEVQSVFDGVFIADSTGSQKCKANVGYGNVDMNQAVGTITPIGAKYPIVITNSKNQYHNGSISGTIVPDDYYFNGNLSRIDMVNKRSELEQFLTNKRAKIIKDWNGNIWLVMIMDNVSCTFNNNYGMGIVNFNTNWVEVGDPTNQEDLQATGLINVGGV